MKLKILGINNYIVLEGTLILNVLKKLTEKAREYPFLIVVNKKKKLLGTITDGDIRRSLIAGKSLKGKVDDFMQKTPIKAYDNNSDNFETLLSRIDTYFPFLPVLNKNDNLVKIVINDVDEKIPLNVLIMAGGYGKRLGDKTKNKPKPLVNVRGKPLLEHIFKNIEKIKVQNIFISVHHLKEQIHDFLTKTKRKNKVKVLTERRPLGTAGSLKLLPNIKKSNILVVNGDILTTLDFEALINFHSKNNSDATIAVANHLVEIPYGVIRHDIKGNFLNLEEKPNINNYVSAGIYCLSNKILKLLDVREYIDMPELLNRGKKKGMNIMIFPIHENWTDIGRPKDLIEAKKNKYPINSK